jgi:hypothetical protein
MKESVIIAKKILNESKQTLDFTAKDNFDTWKTEDILPLTEIAQKEIFKWMSKEYKIPLPVLRQLSHPLERPYDNSWSMEIKGNHSNSGNFGRAADITKFVDNTILHNRFKSAHLVFYMNLFPRKNGIHEGEFVNFIYFMLRHRGYTTTTKHWIGYSIDDKGRFKITSKPKDKKTK